MLEIGETSRGYRLYRKENGVGGHTYWSDEIGGGVMVWDTALVSDETLELALKAERQRIIAEKAMDEIARIDREIGRDY